MTKVFQTIIIPLVFSMCVFLVIRSLNSTTYTVFIELVIVLFNTFFEDIKELKVFENIK